MHPLACHRRAVARPPEVQALHRVLDVPGVDTVSRPGGGEALLVNPLALVRHFALQDGQNGEPWGPERLVLMLGGLGRNRPLATALPAGLTIRGAVPQGARRQSSPKMAAAMSTPRTIVVTADDSPDVQRRALGVAPADVVDAGSLDWAF